MPQYSSTATTPSGIVINTVYDTDADTLTYTATAQNGTTVTATQQTTPSASAAISSDTTNTLFAGLNAAGANLGTPSGFLGTLRSTQTAVKTQSSEASRAAQATNTPVPDAPAPPLSTNNQADPAVAPAPNNTPIVENSSPPAAIPISSDPAQQLQANQDIIDTIRFDGGPAPVSPFNDPAQRAQAQQEAIAAEAPAVISTFEDPAQRGAALQEAIENPGPVSPSDVVDPAQRQQNEVIQSAFPAKISNVQDPSQRAQALQTEIEFADSGPQTAANPLGLDPAQRAQGLTATKLNTASQATQQDAVNFAAKPDWRVRLSLSPGAKAAGYLYWANPVGILAPLQATDGVIFPYTPDVSVAYNANYDPTELTHNNYKFFTYRGSSVDSITIGCTFTAQDTAEAAYVLAVIHFFKSATKMFYGQDQTPSNGTPPPLCYLSGLGAFQFDAHPLAITNFTYKLPTDVDYIIAGSTATPAGVNRQNNPSQGKPGESLMAQAGAARMSTSGLNPGALISAPSFQTNNTGTKEATYVPTKIMLSITAVPIVTRNDISNKFSLKEYATGALLRGTKRAGGGIW